MKLQATVILSLTASSLGDAGTMLDDVLRRAREREDVEVESVELHTPAGSGPVSLPHIAATGPPPERVPHPLPG